jgi:two-component system OmpR family response regulator
VSLAHGSREAAEQLKDTRYKVVLIDLRIPDGSGGDVFRMVRDANPEARTILITGHRSEMDQVVDQIVAEGADAVCYKPFNVPELLAKLEQLAGANDEETGHPPL